MGHLFYNYLYLIADRFKGGQTIWSNRLFARRDKGERADKLKYVMTTMINYYVLLRNNGILQDKKALVVVAGISKNEFS